MTPGSAIAADLTLAPLSADHAPAMLAWMSDREVRENVGVRAEPSMGRTLEWIARASADPACKPMAIEYLGRHVGNVVLDRIDPHARNARLSIYVGEPAFRGHGIGRAALGRALSVAFDDLGLHKIWLVVHAENRRAIAAYLAAGFRTEGMLRDEFPLGDRLVDAIHMGILAHEFGRRQAA